MPSDRPFPRRIHILGAPGSGVTSLGSALASTLACPHFDTDDYYWFTDDELPYRRKRNPQHRLRLLEHAISSSDRYVVSGALLGWGDALLERFDLVIYRWIPVELRLERIRQRETRRYGAERLEAGGDLHEIYIKFLDWAARYDLPTDNIRSRVSELAWVNSLKCPVIKLEIDQDVRALEQAILSFQP